LSTKQHEGVRDRVGGWVVPAPLTSLAQDKRQGRQGAKNAKRRIGLRFSKILEAVFEDRLLPSL
jgi:hypothetical protein